MDDEEKVRIFLSQPMGGKTDAEIAEARASAERELNIIYGEGRYKIIQSYWPDSCLQPITLLGLSLVAMTDADACFFARGWRDARGCRLERAAAAAYGKTCIIQEG